MKLLLVNVMNVVSFIRIAMGLIIARIVELSLRRLSDGRTETVSVLWW